MTEVPIIATEGKTVYVDVCTGCHFVWFDTQEFESLPQVPVESPEAAVLPQEAREAIALAQLEIIRQESEVTEASAPPDYWWQLVLGLTGVPVEYNDAPLQNRPLITWSLAAMIAAVTLTAMGNLQDAVESWGLIPAEFARYSGLTFLTSFFLHAGLFHLIGNLYFLLVFGDNTEDVLGKGRFLLLVAAAAVVGDITHILADPGATIPCVGASGGISGILAYYCLRFPTARVGFAGWFRWFHMPVRLMFAVWVAMQIIDACWIREGTGDVAVFAHLGGAAVGVLFWWWAQRAVSTGARQQEIS
jgi:membrane associated rhomboid family serine protease